MTAITVAVTPPCRRQPGNRHPKRRTTHVVHAYLMAEGDGLRISAVLTADTDLQSPISFSPSLNPDFYQLSNPSSSNTWNGSFSRMPFSIYSGTKEPTSSRLKPKVIWVRSLVPKGKEFGVFCNLISNQRRPRQFDHGTHHVFNLHTPFLHYFFCNSVDIIFQ